MIHELKTLPEYFEAAMSGSKTFEIRRNDRDFRVGDYIALNEYLPDITDPYEYTGKEKTFPRKVKGGSYSGRHLLFEITYILDDNTLLPKEYVALGLSRVI